MVHVGKKEKSVLNSYLLNEGVIAVKEENTGRHEQTKIDNVKVMCFMTSLCSKGFAKKTYNWQHRYYTVTEEGCTFLRQCLGITKENVNPKTHQTKPVEQQAVGGRPEGSRGGFRGDRGGERGGERGAFRGASRGGDAPTP